MTTPSPADAGPPLEATARFVLVTGVDAALVGQSVADLIPGAAHVDAATLAAMLPGLAAPADLAHTFLRFTAGIALADTFRLAGHDTVVSDDVPPEHLDDYLDFAAPTRVHLVRVAAEPLAHDGEPGIRITAGPVDAVARQTLERLDDALVGND